MISIQLAYLVIIDDYWTASEYWLGVNIYSDMLSNLVKNGVRLYHKVQEIWLQVKLIFSHRIIRIENICLVSRNSTTTPLVRIRMFYSIF